MNNARPGHAPNTAQLALTVMEERVDEGAVFMSRRRMDHQIRLFVEDQEVGILKQDIQRNLLGNDLGWGGVRPGDLDQVARAGCLGRLGWPSVDPDTSLR